MPDGATGTTTAMLVEAYIQLRDRIAEIKASHEQILRPYHEAKAALEARLLSDLDRVGAKAIRAKSGTVYTATATSVTVRDWPATLSWIQEHNMWDMLERRVSKSATLAVMEERKENIPGVNVSQAITLHVRRPQ